MINQQEANEDYAFLVQNIKIYEAALDTYVPDFENKANALIEDFKEDSISLIKHYARVNQICALAQEGHFHIGDWQAEILNGFVRDRYQYIPMRVELIDGKFYSNDCFAKENCPPNFLEITSINERTTSEIRELLNEHISADANIQTYTDKKISSGFQWMYYLFIEQTEDFKINYLNEDGEVKETVIKAITRSEMIEVIKSKKDTSKKEDFSKESSTESKFYDFEINGKTAILKLKSFDFRLINELEIEADKFYEKIFTQIKEAEIEHVLIDVRGNTGGRNEFADEIIPFIMKKDVKGLFKTTISWKGNTKNYKMPKRNKTLAFNGKVYLLIDGLSFSAGASIARYIHDLGEAYVIGSESGSRFEGYAAGSAQRINLPNSNIQVDIPRYLISHPIPTFQKDANRGLVPDEELSPSIEDRIRKSDPVMDHVLEMINRGQ